MQTWICTRNKCFMTPSMSPFESNINFIKLTWNSKMQSFNPDARSECISPHEAKQYKLRRCIAFCFLFSFGFAIFVFKNSPSRNTIVLVLFAVNHDFLSKLPLPGKNFWMFTWYTNLTIFMVKTKSLLSRTTMEVVNFDGFCRGETYLPPPGTCGRAASIRVEVVGWW